MKTISLNKNNDFYLDDAGNLALSLDTDAMSEISKNIVLTNKGELEFDILSGIPYSETIFSENSNLDIFQSEIIQALEKLDGVQRVSSFSYKVENNVYKYAVTLITDFGTVVLNG